MQESLHVILREDLPKVAKRKGRILFMPGDGRYQPEELRPFLGYDMWASFLILVEWFWLETLAKIGTMSPRDAALLTRERLFRLLCAITTTRQDVVEKATKGHDILALLQLMRQYLPKALHKYLHLGATSYDIICTAYALILQNAFNEVFWPKLREIDVIWREKILNFAHVVQAGRTHLQTALPITVGFWLAVLHDQYNNCAGNVFDLAFRVPGKFTGAVGTSAALKVMLQGKERHAEQTLMDSLRLVPAGYTTQITPPQATARFYFETVLLTGVLGNLGEDARILQSSPFGEIISASASSSTMAHKKGNPIVAEQDCGMHVNAIAEFNKVMLTLVSDLQRDLRWSSVMRSFSAVTVYSYQQLLTTKRLLSSLAIDEAHITENFRKEANLVMGELLHLALQRGGFPGTHSLVNETVVPAALRSGGTLDDEMASYLKSCPDKRLKRLWKKIPKEIIHLLQHPEEYIGNAIELAEAEANNVLTA